MAERILFVGDALSLLKPASDTSLALAEAALAEGLEVHWCEPGDVAIFGADVVVRGAHAITSVSTSAFSHAPAAPTRVGEPALHSLASYRTVLVRKDPPFDEAYKTLCWILASQTSTPIVNAAERLLAHHEKALQLRARAEGVLRDHEIVPTCVTSRLDVAAAFLSDYSAQAKSFVHGVSSSFPGFAKEVSASGGLRWIVKPWLGHGGSGVQAFDTSEEALVFLKRALAEKPEGETTWMIQPLLPEIKTHGDRRVFVVGGEIVCDFVRLPPEGRIAANLAQGGRAELRPLSPAQEDVARRLAAWLPTVGITIAGIDLIDTFVGEINITSPTGLRTYENLSGKNLAKHSLALILKARP